MAKTPLIIPFFIMNAGCPHRCVFCNQRISAGDFPQPLTKDRFDGELRASLMRNPDQSRKVEVAFYGGSFTGADAAYQEQLLSWAQDYIQRGVIDSIRISTRPDDVTDDAVSLLKKYGVKTVEIGAQSFVDDVLNQAQRGHVAADTKRAVCLLKKNGFHTGLHLMVGLPSDTQEGFSHSLDETVRLKPDTVRIHPVVVLKETRLAEMFLRGEYRPLGLPEAVQMCKTAWIQLTAAGIRVIRMGLHQTPEMTDPGSILAGPIHPAFGSLVLSAVFLDCTMKLMERLSFQAAQLTITLSRRDLSSFCGHRRGNLAAIKARYPLLDLIVETSQKQSRGEITLTVDSGAVYTLKIPGIHEDGERDV